MFSFFSEQSIKVFFSYILKILGKASRYLELLYKWFLRVLVFIYTRKILFLTVISIFVAILIICFIWFFQHKKSDTREQDIKAQRLINMVSRHIILPTGEEPSIAIVSNVELFRKQTAIQNIEKGDQILIYAKAGKMILYSKKRDRIIDVQPLSVGASVVP